ncbi:MAG: hypothetical protein AB1352_01420 [Patescibacteria group bacterium]
MKLALLCGGPSRERGISLNSARSVLDHLAGDGIEILPIYFDAQKHAYRISPAQLYSNTPSDFDFKLKTSAHPLDYTSLIKLLRHADIAFPVIHGSFGEDGGIQRILEKNSIPFIGSSANSCKLLFDKYNANEYIRAHGFYAPPSALLKIYHRDHKQIIDTFFRTHRIKRAVVKPASGGSSIGVFSVATPEQALKRTQHLFSRRYDTRVVIEPFAHGIEFTVIVIQNPFDQPVAIIPTEIEADYTQHQIFDYRKKYLPTHHVTYHCPPRFSDETIDRIQVMAEQLFSLFHMRDFARFDGWVLKDGNIWFSDFNPISGMEQNSFLFQQASRIGLSHSGMLRTMVGHACKRYGITLPPFPAEDQPSLRRKSVFVLFGGTTSERQVSLMSGTNVWLKLMRSRRYNPIPFILDAKQRVWKLPYTYTLNHTTEEIIDNCVRAPQALARLFHYEQRARLRLGVPPQSMDAWRTIPKPLTLKKFLTHTPFVFIALHGGFGENGTLQSLLDDAHIPYNGSGADVSSLCMDKWRTDRAIEQCHIQGIATIPELLIKTKTLPTAPKPLDKLWHSMTKKLRSRTLLVKPRADGCSSGVAHLFNVQDFAHYLSALQQRFPSLPAGTLRRQDTLIEMPTIPVHELIVQKFIETDVVKVKRNLLKYRRVSGWIETTIGVLEASRADTRRSKTQIPADQKRERDFIIFNPSITVAEGEVLTVEEKFQGGTGINITPTPPEIVKPRVIAHAKALIATLARAIGLKGYARVDTFLQVDTGNLLIIEVNTLPALTPSTVLFHQALAERPPLYPRELIEKIIENTGY